MKNSRFIFRQCGLLFFCVVVLSGCSDFHSHLNEMLSNYSCRRNIADKVGPKREAVLFVKHHIMVSDGNSETGCWDHHGFTRTPKETISWESSRFALYRRETIGQIMDGVNEILYAADAHVFLVNDGMEIDVDPEFFPADFDLQGNPRGHTLQVMKEMVANDPQHIHILYGWTSSTKAVAAADKFAVVVADDPRYGTRITSKMLIREIFNALAYEGDDEGRDLFLHSDSSDPLGQRQIGIVWKSLNNEGNKLKSISCRPVGD